MAQNRDFKNLKSAEIGQKCSRLAPRAPRYPRVSFCEPLESYMTLGKKLRKKFQKSYPPPTPKKKGLFLRRGGVKLLNVVSGDYDSA